jgi:hypothetical protein
MGIVGGIHDVVSRLGLHIFAIYGVYVVAGSAAQPVMIGGMGWLCGGGFYLVICLLLNRKDTFLLGRLKHCLMLLRWGSWWTCDRAVLRPGSE